MGLLEIQAAIGAQGARVEKEGIAGEVAIGGPYAAWVILTGENAFRCGTGVVAELRCRITGYDGCVEAAIIARRTRDRIAALTKRIAIGGPVTSDIIFTGNVGHTHRFRASGITGGSARGAVLCALNKTAVGVRSAGGEHVTITGRSGRGAGRDAFAIWGGTAIAATAAGRCAECQYHDKVC